MPRSYLPTLLALKLPEMFVALAAGGVVGALIGAFRRGNDRRTGARCCLLVALAATLPIARRRGDAARDVQRHPAFPVRGAAARGAGGLAGAWLFDALRRRGHLAAMAAAVVFVIGARAAGRRHGAAASLRIHVVQPPRRRRRAARATATCSTTGGSSLKQASQGLAAKIAELKLQKPTDRRWKLAVCGHHRSPQVELGPDFETTWDPKGADFAMMLGEFYCRRFDAPVLVEVVRDGVVYARVYDIRGRSYDTLLTQPGLIAQ